MKRLISVLLSVCLVCSMLPATVYADNNNNFTPEPILLVEADRDGDDTITITEPVVYESSTRGSSLSISADGQSIDRDYDQKLMIQVENISDNPVEYYLTCENGNEDLYMNFVGSGSEDAPLAIDANSKQAVELSVFAQNAVHSNYAIDVTAHIIGGEELTLNVRFSCNGVPVTVGISKGSVDSNTLATSYTIQNSSEDNINISDLTLEIEGEAAEYARINPRIENYELNAGQSVTVSLIPDLGKMKAENKDTVTGKLVAKGGATGEADVSFDVTGKEVTSLSMAELALEQDDNKYADLKFDDDSFRFTTNINGEEVDFADITAEYDDENDSEKDGVNTTEELQAVIDTLIDEDGMIDFSVVDTMTYTDDDGNLQELPVKVTYKTEVVDTPGGRTSAPDSRLRYDSVNGKLITEQTIELDWQEYANGINELVDVAEYLDIPKLQETLLKSDDDSLGKTVKLTVVTELNSAGFDFVEAFADDPLKFYSYADIDEYYNGIGEFARDFDYINDLAEATAPLRTLGDYVGYFNMGVDIYKTSNVWANPNVSAEDKFNYTGLQFAKNLNSQVGGKLFGELGAYIGTAIGDGPGAVVGYFTGHVISGLIGRGLEKWISDLEKEMGLNGLFFDSEGRQCTNAGKVTSTFYLPDFGVDQENLKIYETGRMYDGTPYGGNKHYAEAQFGGDKYIHDRNVIYRYILNGKEIGQSQNTGLTKVSIVELEGSALKPGRNTLIRDYDTNAGHYSVVANTEITVIYPSDTKVNFIDTPKGIDDVRMIPDFAVYEENILPQKAAIIGEENTVDVNVYNRGCEGGWVDIFVFDGETELYKESNVYIAAFSEKKIDFPWTPGAEESTLTVKMINKSIGLDERKDNNNVASRVIYARSRVVPTIESITPAEAYSIDNITIVAALKAVDDVKSARFSIDEDEAKDAKLTITEAGAQAILSVGAGELTVGEHEIKCLVDYYTTGGEASTVEETATIEIKDVPGMSISFSLDDTVNNPVFSVMRYSSVVQDMVPEEKEDGTYVLDCLGDSVLNKDHYTLLVACDGGAIAIPFGSLNDAVLSLDKGVKYTFLKDRDEVELTKVNIYSATTSDTGEYVSLQEISLTDEGTYTVVGFAELEFYISFNVCGISRSMYSSYFYTSEGDAEVDLSKCYGLYQFEMDFDTDISSIEGVLFYKTGSYGYSSSSGFNWSPNNRSGYLNYDSESKLLSLMLAQNNISSDWTVGCVMKVGSDMAFQIDLSAYSDPIVLSRPTCEVSFVCEEEGRELTISVISLTAETYSSSAIRFNTDTLYINEGIYNYSVQYEVDGNPAFGDGTLDTSEAVDDKIEVKLSTVDMASLKLTWPDDYWEDDGYLDCSSSDGNHGSYRIRNGSEFPVPASVTSLSLRLECKDEGKNVCYAIFNTSVELEKDGLQEVDFGNRFTGTVRKTGYGDRKYEAGESCSLNLYSINCGNGVSFSYYNAYMQTAYLNGTITLTSTEDPEKKYTTPFTRSYLSSGSSIDFNLPKDIAAGTYTYSLSLSSTFSVKKEHTVVFNPNGGTCKVDSAVTVNQRLTSLPTAEKEGATFVGWYSAMEGGEKLTTSTVINGRTTVYARWLPFACTISDSDATIVKCANADSLFDGKTIFIAAGYDDKGNVSTVSFGSLGDDEEIKFSKKIKAGYRLFFLTENYIPICEDITLKK